MLEHLTTCRDLGEAYVLQSCLAASGIEATLHDEYTIGINWLWSAMLRGVKVLVEADDRASAVEALGPGTIASEPALETGRPEPADGAVCPRCGGEEIEERRWPRVARVLSPWLATPLLVAYVVASPNVRCRACGRSWRDRSLRIPTALALALVGLFVGFGILVHVAPPPIHWQLEGAPAAQQPRPQAGYSRK